MSKQAVTEVCSSHGTLIVHKYTGKVLRTEDNDGELDNIDMFNIDEHEFYHGRAIRDAVDILDIGYWEKDGNYEPPSKEHREMVEETRALRDFHPGDDERFLATAEACLKKEKETMKYKGKATIEQRGSEVGIRIDAMDVDMVNHDVGGRKDLLDSEMCTVASIREPHLLTGGNGDFILLLWGNATHKNKKRVTKNFSNEAEATRCVRIITDALKQLKFKVAHRGCDTRLFKESGPKLRLRMSGPATILTQGDQKAVAVWDKEGDYNPHTGLAVAALKLLGLEHWEIVSLLRRTSKQTKDES